MRITDERVRLMNEVGSQAIALLSDGIAFLSDGFALTAL